ncbi:MAG: NAD-dependent epimerase/dehydratase family protein [Bacteroidales bacterium]|jgi:NADH dehydrogenase|nr:NAD-dependent epimerase/dehydratase family protein [Bacteroidales bacterium]
MDQTILVTGANGYLGTYICKELLTRGYKVLALKYDHYASTIIEHDNISYLYCDITGNIDEQIGGQVKNASIGAVINAAALLGSSDYDKNYAVNALGVQNMMNFCKAKDITRFIQISSVVILKEFKGPYGETKLIGQEFLEKSNLDYTVFIPAMILGPEGLGINRILKNVFRMPFIVPLVGYGRQTQHPIFVKDFAEYIVKSIDRQAAFKKTYQIAGDEVVSFRNFIALVLRIRKKRKFFLPVPPAIVKLMGRGFQKFQKVPLFTAEHVKGVMQDSRLDTSDLKSDLDFKPTPLEEALTYSLNIIGENWNYYLTPREEKSIKL